MSLAAFGHACLTLAVYAIVEGLALTWYSVWQAGREARDGRPRPHEMARTVAANVGALGIVWALLGIVALLFDSLR